MSLGPRTLTPSTIAAILRFALNPPPSFFKRKYSEADVDEVIQQKIKRPRQRKYEEVKYHFSPVSSDTPYGVIRYKQMYYGSWINHKWLEIFHNIYNFIRLLPASPVQNGPPANSKPTGGSMLECFNCKRLVSMANWSAHPCFREAVNPPNAGGNHSLKRGVSSMPMSSAPSSSSSKNDLFCKYCKLRFISIC